MKYHAFRSPKTLTTTSDPLRVYPAVWELLLWYRCWRKVPYTAEVHAALLAEQRSEGYAHFPCSVDPSHWHIGRGGNKADPKKLVQRAKRSFRKAVRDEIWRDHEAKQKEQAVA